jgi:hypothetical protein
MLCTRCHHDIHRQHWKIRIHNGQVEFTPPPNIDPLQRPRLGGLAALSISGLGSDGDTRENSARENSVREAA